MLKKLFRFLFKINYYLTIKYNTFYYSNLFEKFGEKSKVYGAIKIYNPKNIFIGNNTKINPRVIINAESAKIIIGNNVNISTDVIMNTGFLNINSKNNNKTHLGKEIIIEDGVWIASNAIINPGVIIGKNSVIGAGAVVTRNVEQNIVVAGVPAKKIKDLIV